MSAQLRLKLPRQPTSKNDELLLLLQHGLPPPLQRYWYKSPSDIEALLIKGGLGPLPKNFVSNALRSNHNNTKALCTRPFRNANWYCFDASNKKYDTPMKQLKLQSKDDMPEIPENYFLSFELNYIYATSSDRAQSSPSSQQSTSTHNSTPANNERNGKSVPPANKPENNMPSKWKNGPKTPLPLSLPNGQRIGKTIIDIGKSEEYVRMTEDHVRQCSGNCKLKVTARYKKNFQVFETWGCGFCKFQRTIKGWFDGEDSNEKKKRGAPVNASDEGIVHAAHGSALNPKQLGEFFDQMGCVRMSDSALQRAYGRRKEAVTSVAEQRLRQNKIDHNHVLKEEYGDEYVIEHTDSDGVTHHFQSGPVSGDGAGATRCYYNRVTGKSHCTVIYSLVTGKPLAIKHDQLSCVNCQMRLSDIITGGKRPDEITEDDLLHPGKPCYRNTKFSPANAEENAMEWLGRELLINPITGKFRPDDEAILARDVCTDGDTKGCMRFIGKQAELVPSFKGIAQYLPDIGHFVKCISGALHKLTKECKELKGASLLDSSRIKAIIADISRVIRQYGNELRVWQATKTPNAKEMLDQCRARAMKRINNIIPHHCGNHSTCEYEDCRMIKLRRHFISQYKTLFEDSPKTDEEIIGLHKIEIAQEYAKLARFKGQVMSMGKVGQALVNKEIFKRLDAKSIDRVAKTMSSNGCENFFGMLVKFSHGKRINFDQTDSWKVYQLLAAALKSDDRIEDKIQSYAGIVSSYVRDVYTDKLVKKKEYDRARQKTDEYKRRRTLSQIAKLKDVVKNSTLPERHEPNKLSPKDPCTSETQKKKQRRKRKCTNCKLTHIGKCQEPTYAGPKGDAKRQKKLADKIKLFEESWDLLYGDER